MSHNNYPRAPQVCTCHPAPPQHIEKPFLFSSEPMNLLERFGVNSMLNFIEQEVKIHPPLEFSECANYKEQIFVRIIQVLFHQLEFGFSLRNAIVTDEIRNNRLAQDNVVYAIFQNLRNPNSNKYTDEVINSVEKIPFDIRHFLHNILISFLHHFEVNV